MKDGPDVMGGRGLVAMRARRRRLLSPTMAALFVASAGACDTSRLSQPERGVETSAAIGTEESTVAVQTAFGLPLPPGNLTITPDGRWILSLHQFFAPPHVLAEASNDGQLFNYPAPGEGVLPGLTAVLGIRSDTAGVLYLLDNGNAGQAPSKIVIWNARTRQLQRVIALASAVRDNSFVNDLAFDYKRNQLYLSDPAGGPNAALIVVDLGSGRSRRVLEGHGSVVPENFTFAVDGVLPRRRMRSGGIEPVRIGVDGIGIDYQHEWVYYGSLHGRTMYRVSAAALADASLSAVALEERVERYAAKPPSDGIALDEAGNIYLGDTTTLAYIDARPLNRATMTWFFGHYTRTPADRYDPRITLIRANLRGLPPVTIVTAEIDPLRDDGVLLT